eukprot:5983213-Amphidinium_carterae.1
MQDSSRLVSMRGMSASPFVHQGGLGCASQTSCSSKRERMSWQRTQEVSAVLWPALMQIGVRWFAWHAGIGQIWDGSNCCLHVARIWQKGCHNSPNQVRVWEADRRMSATMNHLRALNNTKQRVLAKKVSQKSSMSATCTILWNQSQMTLIRGICHHMCDLQTHGGHPPTGPTASWQHRWARNGCVKSE